MPHNIKSALNTLHIEIEALQYGLQTIEHSFSEIIDAIVQHVPPGRVIVMGMGKSGHIGNKIAATLASTGTPAFFVHPAEAGHGDLGMITAHDIVIAISQSGKSDELLRVMPYLKRNGIHLIAMTGGLDSPLAQYADWLINTSVPKEACPLGLAPTASTTLTLALGDALAICLLESRGFTAEDFAETHPHGALGRKLLVTVKDVMSPIQQTPVIEKYVLIKEALVTISSAGMGFVVIVDEQRRPIGVFTDGDLRRCLDRDIDIKSVSISSVMTTTFSTVKLTQLAVKAVDIMEHKKISTLPVVDENALLVGAINMRQLLQAGIV